MSAAPRADLWRRSDGSVHCGRRPGRSGRTGPRHGVPTADRQSGNTVCRPPERASRLHQSGLPVNVPCLQCWQEPSRDRYDGSDCRTRTRRAARRLVEHRQDADDVQRKGVSARRIVVRHPTNRHPRSARRRADGRHIRRGRHVETVLRESPQLPRLHRRADRVAEPGVSNGPTAGRHRRSQGNRYRPGRLYGRPGWTQERQRHVWPPGRRCRAPGDSAAIHGMHSGLRHAGPSRWRRVLLCLATGPRQPGSRGDCCPHRADLTAADSH